MSISYRFAAIVCCGLSVLPAAVNGCSSAETKVSGPVSAEAEAAIKMEQQQAEEAEMARQQQGQR